MSSYSVMVRTSVDLHPRLDRLVEVFEREGVPQSRSGVIRMALLIGLAQLDAQYPPEPRTA